MKKNRRRFLKQSALGAAGSPLLFNACTSSSQEKVNNNFKDLDKIIGQPILDKGLFSSPIIIDTVELLRYNDNFICRVRSKDGAEGISVGNNFQLESLYPILVNRLQPFFIGKDARDLERLLEEVYVYRSNYKLQSVALWVPLATIEFAIMDLLGKIANKSIGQLLGDIHNPRVAVYQANNYRGRSAEESIDLIKDNVARYEARALKFKVGGRMSSPDEPSGRTEKLIPLVREAFGDDMTIYADANGGYDVENAIRVGKLMEANNFDFFEEPVPFDWYEETREVTQALNNVPVAGGEQEPSMHNFRWLIGNDALDIVQPDMFYFGGMIRAMKVALMGHQRGKPCVPHISGSGLGYLYMMHFVAATPNAGPYHEFKGFNEEIPLECKTSSLESENGEVKVPTGPGIGVDIDPDYIKKHKVVKA